MSFIRCLYLILAALIFLCAPFINSPLSAEEPQNQSTVEKNKAEILKDIDLFEESLHKSKSCISQATTKAEMEKCRMDEAILRFQKVEDMLSEIGMSMEERRMYMLRPEK
jgi:NhaP-type Na+/H+ and K+/H+ antiporter